MGKLVAANLVAMKAYGPIFMYSINSDNGAVQRIIDLFNEARLLVQTPISTLHWYEIRA